MDYLVDVRLVVIGYINIYGLFMCKKNMVLELVFFFCLYINIYKKKKLLFVVCWLYKYSLIFYFFKCLVFSERKGWGINLLNILDICMFEFSNGKV